MSKIIDWNNNVVHDSPVISLDEPVNIELVSSAMAKNPVWLTIKKGSAPEVTEMIDSKTWVLVIKTPAKTINIEAGKCLQHEGGVNWTLVAVKISVELGYNNWVLFWPKPN